MRLTFMCMKAAVYGTFDDCPHNLQTTFKTVMGCNHKSIAEYYKKYSFKKVLKMQCLVFLLMTNLLHVEAALRKMLTSGATK